MISAPVDVARFTSFSVIPPTPWWTTLTRTSGCLIFWSSETAVGFPITSLREFGRYFSVQVDIGPGYRTPALKGAGRVAESGERGDFMSDLYLFT